MINFVKMPSFLAFLSVLMWAFSFPASKLAYIYFGAIDLTLFRYIFASLFFISFIFFGKISKLEKKDLPKIITLSIISIPIYQLLFIYGISEVSPAIASMIISMIPIFVPIISFILFKEEIKKINVFSIIIGFIGVLFIIIRKDLFGSLFGIGLLIIASILMSLYFILQKNLFAKYTPLELVAYNTWIGTVILLWSFPSLKNTLLQDVTIESIISIVIMGIFSSGIAFVLWFSAIEKSSPNKVSIYLYIQPVVVGIMSWIWTYEIPTWGEFIGGMIIFISLILPKTYEHYYKERK